MVRPLLEPLDAAERLNQDDQATRLEQQALASALLAQAERRRSAPPSAPGLCLNCRSACSYGAVYCDADCRDDHEARLAVLARQGRPAA